MPTRRALLALPALVLAGPAVAQDWPSRPLRVVVPFAPGGSSDIAARLVVPGLSAALGQQVVVENRGGAGGNVAAELVARAMPDGYTVFQGNVGILAVNPALYPALTWDALRDFAPVSHLMSVFYVLVVPADRPWRSVADLIAAAKAQPETLSAGNSGVGSMGHLASAIFDSLAGVRTVPVPYRGGGPMATDVIAGKLDFAFSTAPTVLPAIEAGQVRALAVGTASRTALLPQVPTVAEAGVPGFEVPNWDGWLVPRGTPPAAVTRLNAALREVLAVPDTVEAFRRRGMEPMPGTPEALGREIGERIAQFGPVVRATGARIN